MLKQVFIKRTPFFLLLPASLAVGLYCFEKFDLLYNNETQSYFYYYLVLAAAPLYFLLIKGKSGVGEELFEVAQRFLKRFGRHGWMYAVFILTVSGLFLATAYFHISTFTERDRWILEDDLPIIPIDAPIPLRFAWALSKFLPIDLATPVLGLLFLLLWFVFLVYLHGEEEGGGWLVLLVFSLTFMNKAFFELLYANFELPSAILGWIGLYGIWKKRFNLGFLFVAASVVMKNSGIFQLAAATAVFAYVLYGNRPALHSIVKKLDVSFVLFLGGYLALNYWGSFYYMFALRGGPEYVLVSGAERVIWFSSFSEFTYVLFRDYGTLLVLGGLGLFHSRMGLFPLLSFGSLVFVRSFSSLSVGYYALIFLAAISFFAYFGLGFIRSVVRTRALYILSACLVGLHLFYFFSLFSSYPFWMNKLNSNFTEFIHYTAENFPSDGRIYHREVSIIPYLDELGRSRFGDVRFRIYPEDKQAALDEFSLPGCKLIVMQKDDLGISADELASLGFSRKPYELRDEHGMWHSFSRDCQ